MSKFLKFIIHLVIICAIICACGLVLPPFFGVNTVIIDSNDKKTNLPMGSVTYAIPEKTEEVYVGEPILVQEDSSIYRYEVKSLDLENHTGTVVDPSITDGKAITVAVRDYVPKVVITIGYVGYLLVATKSIEGLIILGLAVLFLIILFIIAELWKKDEEDDYRGRSNIKSKKELRREEKERQKRYKEEEREIRSEERGGRRKKKSEKRKLRTGGFVDEFEVEDEDEEVQEVQEVRESRNRSSFVIPEVGDANDTLKKNVQEVTEEDSEEYEDEYYEDEEEYYEDEEDSNEEETAAPAEESGAPKRAIPSYTAQELAEFAREDGDSPDIMKDDITDITLFDYSDLFEEK